MERSLVSVAAAVLSLFATQQALARDTFARLDGAQETPSAGDPDGSGAALIEVKPNAANPRVCVSLGFQGIAAPTAMHIHSGAVGVAGPVVINLATVLSGEAQCVSAPLATVKAINKNPQNFYINIHNAAFPGGAVRGQLEDSDF